MLLSTLSAKKITHPMVNERSAAKRTTGGVEAKNAGVFFCAARLLCLSRHSEHRHRGRPPPSPPRARTAHTAPWRPSPPSTSAPARPVRERGRAAQEGGAQHRVRAGKRPSTHSTRRSSLFSLSLPFTSPDAIVRMLHPSSWTAGAAAAAGGDDRGGADEAAPYKVKKRKRREKKTKRATPLSRECPRPAVGASVPTPSPRTRLGEAG